MTRAAKIGAMIAIILMGAAPRVAGQTEVEQGKKVYTDQKCNRCHSIGNTGNKKGPLDNAGTKLTADEIKQWMIDPKTMTEKTKATRKPAMPAYTRLPAEDLAALVVYLQTLKAK